MILQHRGAVYTRHTYNEKGDVGNAIYNTKRKTALAIFSAYNALKGVFLLLYFWVTVRKPCQQEYTCWFIRCRENS